MALGLASSLCAVGEAFDILQITVIKYWYDLKWKRQHPIRGFDPCRVRFIGSDPNPLGLGRTPGRERCRATLLLLGQEKENREAKT